MSRLRRSGFILASLLAALGLSTARADDSAASRFSHGSYVAPMASGVFPTGHHAPLKDGYGGTLAFGYRNDWYAVEIAPEYADLKHAEQFGAALRGLLFPFKGNFYTLLGVEALDYNGFDTPTKKEEFNTVGLNGGLGYIWPLSMGRYDFGIRSELVYRYGERERKYNDRDIDIEAPKYFKQVVANVGLYLPLGFREPVAAPAPEPAVAVVAALPVCSDGQDNDGDGLVDFPADKGCSAADDLDETDPPVCSDGIDNDGDGLIDFPNDKGCSAADDGDETDPCKAPAPGERISLKGCGTGDIIVLRGVNFDFDSARLTANAKTILDNVAEELTAYPEIKVELDGHTDAKGSDEYNQTLSEKRAAAVMAYLKKKDIAGDRMTSAGFGESKPVADNETDEGRELNRRVELKVTEGVATVAPVVPAADAPAAEAMAPAESAESAEAIEAAPAP